MDNSSSIQLLVTFHTNNNPNEINNTFSGGTSEKGAYLHREEGKRSIFYLKNSTCTPPTATSTDTEKDHNCYFEITAPASIIIQCPHPIQNKQQQNLPFVFGGIEILSNSRNIELYACKNNGDNKEEYIQTYRGVRSDDAVINTKNETNNNDEWYKTLIVQQPSPISITSFKLKFLSLRPAKSKQAIIRSLNVTCRLPDEKDVYNVQSNSDEQEKNVQSNNPMQNIDIQGALHAMPGVIRMTEESMMNRISTELNSIKRSSDSLLQQNMVFVYKEIHELKQAVIMQNSIIKEQQNTIQKLMDQQDALLKGQELILKECIHWKEKSEENINNSCSSSHNNSFNSNDARSIGSNNYNHTFLSHQISKTSSFYDSLFQYLEFKKLLNL